MTVTSHSLQLVSDLYFSFDQSNQDGILFQLCQLIFLCTPYVVPVRVCVCILERRGKKCIVEKNLLQNISLIFWKCIGRNFKLMTAHSVFFFFPLKVGQD